MATMTLVVDPADGEEPRPTPALLGNRRRVRARHVGGTLSAPSGDRAMLMSTLQLLGLVERVMTERFHPVPEHSHYPELLANEINPRLVVSLWTQILRGEIRPGVVDLLCVEYWFSRGYPQLVDALSERFTYSKTLLTIRQRVAISLHDYARDLNWRRPVTFVAALKIARAYLRDAVGHESAMREDLRNEFTGRLGVSTVLISRFESVSLDELLESRLALQRSLEQGNDARSALPYLVEAAVAAFDLSAKPAFLKDALGACAAFGDSVDSDELRLAKLDAYLRLMESNPDDGPFLRLEIARLIDSVASSTHTETRIRSAMARGLIDTVDTEPPGALSFRGVRLPFGYRDSESVHLSLRAAAPAIYDRLINLTDTGEPMATGILADLLTECGASLVADPVTSLRRAIKLRQRLPGSDARNELLNLRDRAALARSENDPEARRDALLGLVGLSSQRHTAAPALVLIARNVEKYGGIPMPIAAGTPADHESALRLVAGGDHLSLWGMAAQAALGDSNLTTVNLGGRSGVTTIGDYYGLSAESLVFKRRNRIAFERDSDRDGLIRRFIEEEGHGHLFSVPVTLTSAFGGVGESEVVAVRRYIRGTSLQDALSGEDLEHRVAHLADAARFLGLINRAEHSDSATGVRGELKSKEMGRWLRRCGLGDPSATFEAWWTVMQKGALVRRRDAHLGNWLLADDGRLVAMDLEAQGWRPVGYDLAQVTDDHHFLDIRDWASRRVVFDAYREARRATDASRETEWVAYQAGVLARLVWALTDPNDGPFASGEAESRLQGFVEVTENEELSAIASEILAAWLRRRGLVDLPKRLRKADGAGRIRLSRSMAYHLRHDPNLPMDEGGWTTLGDLAEAVQRGTTPELLATVATDRREARFELSDGRIRARYGHSLDVQLDHSAPSRPLMLYHASPWAHAASILDRRQGLERGNRQWVHLTDSLHEAVMNGVREGHPLVYQVSSQDLPELLAASGHTFLARSVSKEALSVVPVSAYWDQVPTIGAWLAPT